jgi:hypothetical protein
MNEQQSPQSLKLNKTVVGCLHRPQSLLPIQPNPYMRSLYHIDIVGPVADSQSYFILVVLNKGHDVTLSPGAHPAADDAVAL